MPEGWTWNNGRMECVVLCADGIVRLSCATTPQNRSSRLPHLRTPPPCTDDMRRSPIRLHATEEGEPAGAIDTTASAADGKDKGNSVRLSQNLTARVRALLSQCLVVGLMLLAQFRPIAGGGGGGEAGMLLHIGGPQGAY